MIKINPILIISIIALIWFCFIADWGSSLQVDGWAWVFFTCAVSINFYFAGYITRLVEGVLHHE